MNKSIRVIGVIWLAWVIVLLASSHLSPHALQPARPDRALSWTVTETTATSQLDKPYLIDPIHELSGLVGFRVLPLDCDGGL